MADTPQNTDPQNTPPDPEGKHSAPRGKLNQVWLQEFTNGEDIVAATRAPGRAEKLAEGGIDSTKIEELVSLVAEGRKLAGMATHTTSDKEITSDMEEAAKQALILGIQYIQKRARQKYDATAPGKLADFAIGQHYTNSRRLLEQAASGILLKLNGDSTEKPPILPEVLPGVTPAKIIDLQNLLDAYKTLQAKQSGVQGDATTWRKKLEAIVSAIIARRREIQFAADADWPHTDPANAGIRGEFQLPLDRMLK